jgi:RimJ/RimL family protein N-acetyltransferase
MVAVLADPSIYEYTGGEAPTLEHLHGRYAAQLVGRSADDSVLIADLAWVVTPAWQGQRIASEATWAMIGWLRSKGISHFVAHIHPDHQVSMSVARNQGLHPTGIAKDDEVRWES